MKLLRVWSFAIAICLLMTLTSAGEIKLPANNSVIFIGGTFPFKYDPGFRIPELITQKIDILIGTTAGSVNSGVAFLGSLNPSSGIYRQVKLSIQMEVANTYDGSKSYFLIVSETLKDINDPKLKYEITSIPIKLVAPRI